MKKIMLIFFTMFCFTLPSTTVSALSVSAQYACVIDAQTGRVIYEKNAYSPHSMASTTKIMTALVALENSNLSDIVTVSKNAAGVEGTSLYLKPGEKIVMEDLLYGLLLQSGNDAAIAIAEHIAGSTEKFALLMTSRAKNIGAKNTVFKNPNGLDEDGHVTTAYDLALITQQALKNEIFSKIVATKSIKIKNGTQTVTNHNKMLTMYSDCIGVKTGFTKKTGRCLVTAAERGGTKIIAVTLNAPDDWNDHKNMLNHAFENSVCFPLFAAGMTVNSVTVKDGTQNTLELTAARDFYLSEDINTKFQNAQISCKVPPYVTAPIKQGEEIGRAEIYYKDKLLDSIPLIAATDITYKKAKKASIIAENFKKLLLFSCTKR
ncbi:MAG: D-alanyl-D-alanine carboxypeptidase [Clostridia bacterium]|nr:D-alanyl-D-alanine carboxypeptidase [Clostridia bacterium]